MWFTVGQTAVTEGLVITEIIQIYGGLLYYNLLKDNLFLFWVTVRELIANIKSRKENWNGLSKYKAGDNQFM